MALPTMERITMFSSRKNILLLLILMACIIFATYHQLYNKPFSSNYRPCSNNNESQYKILKTQPAISLGNDEKFDLHHVEENLHSLDQKDPQLIQYTRVRYVTPPSKQPYNLGDDPNISQPSGFSKFIAKLFNYKRNGLFIEAGANDGGKTSHTLYLEKDLGWSGLLVECNPTVVPFLQTKHRKAWIAGVCLSPTGHAETFNFSNPTSWSYSGTLGKPWKLPGQIPNNWNFFDVQAIPFYTILAGLGWKEVDFFSFDVEGQELAILRNFPFDLFRFKVLIYEEQFTSNEERSELDTLLKKNGYVFLKTMEYDRIYVHGEFYKEMGTAAMMAAKYF